MFNSLIQILNLLRSVIYSGIYCLSSSQDWYIGIKFEIQQKFVCTGVSFQTFC